MGATAVEPSEFTAVCSITLPIAVIEYWNPIGNPIMIRFLTYCLLSCRSSLVICKRVIFFIIYIRHRTPDIACDKTVANAAPKTPI